MLKRTPKISHVEAPCDGKGKATIQDWLSGDELTKNLMMFSTVTLEVGTEIGNHKHDGDLEVYQIVSGKCEYDDNGKIEILTAGDVVICYDGESHGMKNIGDDQAVFNAFIVRS